MNGIVSIRSKTSRLLGQELGLRVFHRENYVPDLEHVIRWGSIRPLTISGIELNNAEAIKKASNKSLCRQFLYENGIPVPEPSETDFPLIGRTEKHSQGSGFFYIKDETELWQAKLRGAVYFSRFYPKQSEYRVHVAGGKCILMSVKEGNKSALIWNKRKSGFNFRHLHRHIWLEDEQLRNIVRKAKKAVILLGLDFGAVDVMADAGEDYPSFVISEINTSPSLSPLAMEKYVKYFRERLWGENL